MAMTAPTSAGMSEARSAPGYSRAEFITDTFFIVWSGLAERPFHPQIIYVVLVSLSAAASAFGSLLRTSRLSIKPFSGPAEAGQDA